MYDYQLPLLAVSKTTNNAYQCFIVIKLNCGPSESGSNNVTFIRILRSIHLYIMFVKWESCYRKIHIC